MPALIEMPVGQLPKIEAGDAGIILKADGSFQVFNTETSIDPDNLSEQQLELGRKIMGLSAALQVPEIMEILVRLANDPAVFDKAVRFKHSA